MTTDPGSSGAMPASLRSVGPMLMAVALAGLVMALGLRGGDVAAQVFRAHLVSIGGLVVWDGAWYGGIYPLSYSVLAPVLVAVLGISATSIVLAGVAAWGFDRLMIVQLGRRTPGVWYFAVSTVLAVGIGQVTYLAGEAAALWALAALAESQRRDARWPAITTVVLGVLSALLSPLAAAFLVLVLAIWGYHLKTQRRLCLVAGTATSVVVLGLGLMFPGDGPFPFGWGGLLVVEALCLVVLSPLVRVPKSVRAGAAVYGLATLASFVISNPLGGNATRLAESAGIPLVAALITRPAAELSAPALSRTRPLVDNALARLGRHRWTALACLVPFVVWQWAPVTGVVTAAAEGQDPATTAAFYAALEAHVPGHNLVKIEVVPTLDHWESVYVTGRLIVARGWERQVDVQDNPIFYTQGALNARSYRTWLLDQGVSYVALPNTTLDYAGRDEAKLLRSHKVAGLVRLWHSRNWTLWRVKGSTGLVQGPATMTDLDPDSVTLQVLHQGTLTIKIRYSSFWNISSGNGCVEQSPQGWTTLVAQSAGTFQLNTSILSPGNSACPTNRPQPIRSSTRRPGARSQPTS